MTLSVSVWGGVRHLPIWRDNIKDLRSRGLRRVIQKDNDIAEIYDCGHAGKSMLERGSGATASRSRGRVTKDEQVMKTRGQLAVESGFTAEWFLFFLYRDKEQFERDNEKQGRKLHHLKFY